MYHHRWHHTHIHCAVCVCLSCSESHTDGIPKVSFLLLIYIYMVPCVWAVLGATLTDGVHMVITGATSYTCAYAVCICDTNQHLAQATRVKLWPQQHEHMRTWNYIHTHDILAYICMCTGMARAKLYIVQGTRVNLWPQQYKHMRTWTAYIHTYACAQGCREQSST